MVWGGLDLNILSQPDELLFMLYRLMLVDEWPYDDMMSTNKPMTYLLVGSYLMVVAILLLNLFIALLSDTFQRIYDNAVSNASMQRAIFLTETLQNFSDKDRRNMYHYLHTECNPVTEDWDDDASDEAQDALKKITHQMYDRVDELARYVRDENWYVFIMFLKYIIIIIILIIYLQGS